jgi:hypothetical protein
MRPTTYSILLILSCPIVVVAGEFDYHKDFAALQAASQDSTSEFHYIKLLNRFQANDKSLTPHEVLALLIGYTMNEAYHPYSDLDIERGIYRLNAKQEFQAALAVADSFLLTHPVSQMALIEKSYAHHKLGDADSADFYSWQFQKIMEAMDYSGKCTSANKACFALGPADGQNFVRKFVGWKIKKMGSGRDNHNSFLDIIWAEPEENAEPIAFFFHVDHAMREFREQAKKVMQK